jgi:hypothetical protein
MRKTTIFLFVIFLSVAVYCYRQPMAPLLPSLAGVASKLGGKMGLVKIPEIARPETHIARVGEEIVYNIKYKGIHIGVSRFNCLNRSQVDGTAVDVITLKTEVPNFKDVETIYSDPVSHLPLRVERDISRWPFWERIVELYDQKNFKVNITKDNGSENTIVKDRPIHNPVLLPYFIRGVDDLRLGWNMTVTFPTQQFLVTLVSMEDLEVPAGKFKTYHFQSHPEKFEIWITADERKIPIKIQGLGIFGYAMLMKEYK